jgi:hypothetical protein
MRLSTYKRLVSFKLMKWETVRRYNKILCHDITGQGFLRRKNKNMYVLNKICSRKPAVIHQGEGGGYGV